MPVSPYYASPGDTVFFKIYQASTNTIFDAVSSMPVPVWSLMGTNLLDTLQANSTSSIKSNKDDSGYGIDINPNPANQNTIIKLNVKDAYMEVFDMSGKLCKAIEVQSGTIPISDLKLENGIYFVKLTDKERVFSKRLTIID